jgi:predicted phage terminase large subunit-like protein
MIDGEGAVKYGSINITQDCALHTGVCRRIEEVLGQLNIPYKLGQYKGTQNTYVLAGGRDVKMKLLRFGCMGKADDVIQNMYTHAGSPVQCENRVVDIIPDGEETVYSFQTETGNYVIWGYMSKNCQYMLSPVDDSSSIFKKNDIQYYAELPKLVAKYITIDLAISQRETADYFVCMVTGVTEDKKLYVVDYTRCRCLPKQQIDIIFETFEKHRELVKSVGIETVAYQKALLYLIKDEMRRRGIYMPLQELKADTDKIRRAQSLQPLFENHEVFIRLNHKELEQELLEFPVGVHDDTVDALAYVLQLLKPGKLSILKRKYAYNLGNRFTGY